MAREVYADVISTLTPALPSVVPFVIRTIVMFV